jgi:hypothetical protein
MTWLFRSPDQKDSFFWVDIRHRAAIAYSHCHFPADATRQPLSKYPWTPECWCVPTRATLSAWYVVFPYSSARARSSSRRTPKYLIAMSGFSSRVRSDELSSGRSAIMNARALPAYASPCPSVGGCIALRVRLGHRTRCVCDPETETERVWRRDLSWRVEGRGTSLRAHGVNRGGQEHEQDMHRALSHLSFSALEFMSRRSPSPSNVQGLHPQSLAAVVGGALLAVHRAHNFILPGTLSFGTGRVSREHCR